jgi:hypothetical protein
MVGLADRSGDNVLLDSGNVHDGMRGSLRRSDSLIQILERRKSMHVLNRFY